MKISISSYSSFFTGFICAIIIVGLIWTYFNFSFIGGLSNNSPNGKYSLSIYSKLAPRYGGDYTIILEDKVLNNVIRRVNVSLSSTEKHESLRGNPNVIKWSPNSDFADININNKSFIRLFVP
jgi:hypothetical protein